MKIFITGAGGFLGTHILFKLLAAGHEVTALLRTEKHPVIEHPLLTICRGDILEKNSFTKALQTCEMVIHVAATTDTRLRHYEDYREINVEGTQNVLEAAVKGSLKRFIFISTANTIGYGNTLDKGNENRPMEFPFTQSFYAQSKREAEELLFKLKAPLDWVILNPCFMLGAYDFKPTSGELVLMGYKKPLLFIPKGGKNFVFVEDASEAVLNALQTPYTQQKFLLGNQNLSFKDFYKLQAKQGGYKQKVIILPSFLLSLAGFFGDFLRFLGVKTQICTRNLNQLKVQEYYDCSKAQTLLNLPQTSIETAIEKTLGFFRGNQKIR